MWDGHFIIRLKIRCDIYIIVMILCHNNIVLIELDDLERKEFIYFKKEMFVEK